MNQEQQENSILKEEDRILKVRQGGVVIWGARKTPYCAYAFMPCEHDQQYNKGNVEEFYSIGSDILKHFSQDRLCLITCHYSIKERAYMGRNNFTDPVYVEDGKVNQFKQYLKNSNRKDLLWEDYMYYMSESHPYKIFRLFGYNEVRSYARDIYILQEKLDFELVERAKECSCEGLTRDVAIFIYPHPQIQHKENNGDTVISYVHSTDTFLEIGIGDDDLASICIEPNPKYLTYDQLLKEIEPIFNKYGWKFGNMENPYIKALKCDVNCLECDDLECNYNLKDNEVYHYVYHRVETD